MKTDKFTKMIEAFECDLSLVKTGEADLVNLQQLIENKDSKVLEDIELLEELSFLLRNGQAEIHIKTQEKEKISVYDELLERVENGERFWINFSARSLKVGKDYLIKEGEICDDRWLTNPEMQFDFEILEALYDEYYHSLPSERSDKQRHNYFKAKSFDDLTDKELMFGTPRELARAQLEGYILCMIMTGQFKWKDEYGGWFWQSRKYPEFVILRQWIEGR